jgi:RNA polymerase sigma factor (sigma-70 family)
MQTVQYDNLSSYLNLAKKIISKFGKASAKNMLKNEDVVADVAHAIMVADWKYDNDRVGKITGKKKTRYSYRNQCAIWAIQTYLTKKGKGRSLLSIDNYIKEDDNTYDKLIIDESEIQPLDNIINDENLELTNELVEMIFNSNILNDRQKQQLRMYYIEDYTLQEIGDHFNITREAVRQTIKNSIKKLREILT